MSPATKPISHLSGGLGNNTPRMAAGTPPHRNVASAFVLLIARPRAIAVVLICSAVGIAATWCPRGALVTVNAVSCFCPIALHRRSLHDECGYVPASSRYEVILSGTSDASDGSGASLSWYGGTRGVARQVRVVPCVRRMKKRPGGDGLAGW